MTDVDELVRCITALLALNERNVLVPHGVPGLARDCLKSAVTALERMREERDEARSRFNDIDLCKMGQAPCSSLLAAEAEAARLREALLDHNDLLRSAFQAAQRDAIHEVPGTTNYRTLADRASEVLTKHHATTNAARQALAQRSE